MEEQITQHSFLLNHNNIFIYLDNISGLSHHLVFKMHNIIEMKSPLTTNNSKMVFQHCSPSICCGDKSRMSNQIVLSGNMTSDYQGQITINTFSHKTVYVLLVLRCKVLS